MAQMVGAMFVLLLTVVGFVPAAVAADRIDVVSTVVEVPDGIRIVQASVVSMTDDGTAVAFVGHRFESQGGPGEVYLWRKGVGTILVDSEHAVDYAHISPTGTHIVYSTTVTRNSQQVFIYDVQAETAEGILAGALDPSGRVTFTADGSVVVMQARVHGGYGRPVDARVVHDIKTGETTEYRGAGPAWISGDGNYLVTEDRRRGPRLLRNLVTNRTHPLGTEERMCQSTCPALAVPQISNNGQRFTRVANEQTEVIYRDIVSQITFSRSFDAADGVSGPGLGGDMSPVMNGNGTVVFTGTVEVDENGNRQQLPFRWDPIARTDTPINGAGEIYDSNDVGDIVLARTGGDWAIWELSGTPPPESQGFDWMFATSVRELTLSKDFQPAQADVVRLYWAFFNREPDLDGTKYWLAVNNTGHGLDAIANNFALSQEFAAKYSSSGNEEFLTVVYQNVLGRQYDQSGFQYWLNLLNTNQINRGGVVRWVAANNEFIDKYPYPET